jgi:hypothetical protein
VRHWRFAFENELVFRHIGENVLAEQSRKSRETLDDFGQPLLSGRIEARAGADEILVRAFENAKLFGIQPERPARLV